MKPIKQLITTGSRCRPRKTKVATGTTRSTQAPFSCAEEALMILLELAAGVVLFSGSLIVRSVIELGFSSF